MQKRRELVEISEVVAGPILQARVHNFQLEGEHCVEEMCLSLGGFDASEDREEVVAFDRCLVE